MLLTAGGMPDHIHLVVGLHRDLAVSQTLRLIKANSSKWVHQNFPERQNFGWQVGYGAFTVSYSNLPSVRKYVENQAEHHHMRSFQEEFRVFLKQHEIPFDERYVWD